MSNPSGVTDLGAFFQEVDNEFLNFQSIEEKLSNRPDLHAFILLDRLCPGDCDIVACAEHDQIYLEVDTDELLKIATRDELIDLVRCGVMLGEEGLEMFA